MSLSNAMTSAVSGLTATARQAEVLTSNVANATTPGYARRELSLAADANGSGVKIIGVARSANAFLEMTLRLAQAEVQQAEITSSFLKNLEKIMGTPEDGGALVSRVAELEAAFIAASSRPESEPNLTAAVNAAKSLANGLNEASVALQAERQEADRAISFAVDQLNYGLSQLQKLNATIQSFNATGRDISALLDQRSQLLDGIADLIPLRVIDRANDQISIVTSGGAILLEGKAAVIAFSPSSMITPEMSAANGALSGLRLNGTEISTSGAGALLAGGKIGALFELRDGLAVAGQARLDAMARDLIERTAAIDPALAPGAAGLFTDAGVAFDPAQEIGLAGRIAVNPLVDGAQGGSALRLRDGLSGGIGAIGDASLLNAYSEAFAKPLLTSSAALSSAHRSLAGIAADILSLASVQRLNEERQLGFAQTRLASLQDLNRANGVDLDEEIQSLLALEKIYAANSKVLQTLNDMLEELLRI